MEYLVFARRAAPVALLALFWCWETWRPFFGRRESRWKHAGRNLLTALINTVALGVVFGAFTVAVAHWTEQHEYGLLNALGLTAPVRFALALVLLDGWMYVWHRANHMVPLLWRFHRMHHSDTEMDVTTATRFHIGEHIGSAVLRLGLIPIFGLSAWHLVMYDICMVAVTQFHHADISLGRWDKWLRVVVVTPFMHKVHHSQEVHETNSNYSAVLSLWDRLAGSFRMRTKPQELVFGLRELKGDSWQTVWGLFKTPFVTPPPADRSEAAQA